MPHVLISGTAIEAVFQWWQVNTAMLLSRWYILDWGTLFPEQRSNLWHHPDQMGSCAQDILHSALRLPLMITGGSGLHPHFLELQPDSGYPRLCCAHTYKL